MITKTLYETQIEVAQSVLETIDIESLAVLGPAGSNSHLVARDMLETSDSTMPSGIILCDSFQEIVERVDSEPGCVGVLPVTNSIGGDVLHDSSQSMTNKQAARRAGHQALAAVGLPVEHCLLGRDDGITETRASIVYSNPQALRQCARYIREKGLTAVDTSSTSAAARALANAELPEDSVVIASPLAGEVYDLPVIEEDVGDRAAEENVTTMTLFSRPISVSSRQLYAYSQGS